MTEVQASGTQAVVRNISDTARWAAVFRARETKRADALFRDPYAERLAGKMGVDIANTLPEGNSHARAWTRGRTAWVCPLRCSGSKSICRRYLLTKREFLRTKSRFARWSAFESICPTAAHGERYLPISTAAPRES